MRLRKWLRLGVCLINKYCTKRQIADVFWLTACTHAGRSRHVYMVLTLQACAYSSSKSHPPSTSCSELFAEFDPFRRMMVREAPAPPPTRAAAPARPSPPAAKTYTVKKGDCLWNIAKQLYGSGADYSKIYEANKGTVGSNPNLIYPGQVLTIP